MTLNIQALHSQSDRLDAAQMSNKPNPHSTLSNTVQALRFAPLVR
jgi:hypothetical protein